jgi:hypothetical protein
MVSKGEDWLKEDWDNNANRDTRQASLIFFKAIIAIVFGVICINQIEMNDTDVSFILFRKVMGENRI